MNKPLNPHKFRQYWTTIATQDNGLNEEEIKFLLGHKQERNGLNITWNHADIEILLSNTGRKMDDVNGMEENR